MIGTTIGEEMLSRSTPSLWDNPMWDTVDVKAGGVMPGEAQLLYGLVRALRPNLILEVGTSHGYSTLHLAAGCRDNGTGFVYTVETDTGRRAKAIENLESNGFVGWVSSQEEIPELVNLDLIFFDAEHTAEDILGYLDEIGIGWKEAVIVIHDAEFDNRHARRVADIIKRPCVVFGDTSKMGIALLGKVN